jgi:hypothetical protein
MLGSAKALYVSARDGMGRLMFESAGSANTAERVHLDTLGLGAPDRISYTPSGWLALRRALPRKSVTPDDVFIDYGSGKGRVVLQAARYPLKRVIGLEIAPELNAAARANLELERDRLSCQDVELVTADVLDFELPDDVTIAYMYNPFRGETFSAAIERLIASVDRRPRRVRIVYVNPLEHDRLIATGRIELVRKIRGLRPGARWSRTASTYLYEISPPRGG